MSCLTAAQAQTDFRHINLKEALAAAKKEKKLVLWISIPTGADHARGWLPKFSRRRTLVIT